MPVEVPVLQLDAGTVRAFGDEAHLDLTCPVRVGLDLPLGADIPAEHHPVRRLVGQDPRPPALASIRRAVVDMPSGPRLEHRLGDRGGQQVVLRRLELTKPPGECRERLRLRRVHHDLPADHGGIGPGHELSSVAESTTSA